MKAQECIDIFNRSIRDYHEHDDVDHAMESPYETNTIEHLMYLKNWIDTVQWHLEDIIRDPNIDPVKGMEIKRRIDHSNQNRTDTVEHIDDYYIKMFADVSAQDGAEINTESPAWVVDRLSILCLKIYHMHEQVERADTSLEHFAKCNEKFDVLMDQEADLVASFNALLEEYQAGTKKIKVYRQMKMYNDDSLNPVLYSQKK